MKKLLILLAALSLVGCSSNKPKEQMMETVPVAMEEEVVIEETPVVVEEVVIEEVILETPTIEEAPTYYTVVDGDNLFQIGLKYNMSWNKLSELNHISNPDVILVGQKLMIPTK